MDRLALRIWMINHWPSAVVLTWSISITCTSSASRPIKLRWDCLALFSSFSFPSVFVCTKIVSVASRRAGSRRQLLSPARSRFPQYDRLDVMMEDLVDNRSVPPTAWASSSADFPAADALSTTRKTKSTTTIMTTMIRSFSIALRVLRGEGPLDGYWISQRVEQQRENGSKSQELELRNWCGPLIAHRLTTTIGFPSPSLRLRLTVIFYLLFWTCATGVAGGSTANHSQCQSQQHLSDDVFEETVS